MGFPPIPERVPKSAEKVRRTALFAHFLCTFCAKSAVLRTFRHFSALFLESAEAPLFVQINVFAVWPLRLDRKYTNPTTSFHIIVFSLVACSVFHARKEISIFFSPHKTHAMNVRKTRTRTNERSTSHYEHTHTHTHPRKYTHTHMRPYETHTQPLACTRPPNKQPYRRTNKKQTNK